MGGWRYRLFRAERSVRTEPVEVHLSSSNVVSYAGLRLDKLRTNGGWAAPRPITYRPKSNRLSYRVAVLIWIDAW